MTSARLLLILPAIALLAACTTGAPGSAGTSTGGGSSDGGTASDGGGDCAEFGEDFAPFSSDLIASQSGTVWGDGSAFEITLSDDAIAAELLPQVEFLSNVNGGVQTASSQTFDDLGGGKYSNNLNLFDSQFDGQPGIAQVFAITDVSFDGEQYNGDTLVLGNYCVTLEVE